MKKNRDEPIRVIIHIYMETSQGNSLCSYLKQAKNVIYIFFSSTESENRRVEQVLPWEGEGGLVPVEGGKWLRKGVGGRIWCKYCVHIYVNGKMIPTETIPRMARGGDKGEW
jgi:hypothetical protein